MSHSIASFAQTLAADMNCATQERTVLVIDDDSNMCDMMNHYLLKEGFRVQMTGTGVQGLALAQELLPDAITLDVLLPDMDGWELLALLKADAKLAQIPVIVMSMVDDKNTGFMLGATGYLTKPIDYKHLAQILKQYPPS